MTDKQALPVLNSRKWKYGAWNEENKQKATERGCNYGKSKIMIWTPAGECLSSNVALLLKIFNILSGKYVTRDIYYIKHFFCLNKNDILIGENRLIKPFPQCFLSFIVKFSVS